MMTSVGNERTRGTREKPQIPTPQTQPQKQATAEQIRLAQMIYDKNDADFEDKVKQLMEVTGKNQDECIVALHDCNGDVNRAINILLEGNSDTTSWETVGGKKKIVKESSENKENREKRGDREVSRGRGTSNRRGRGGSRGREFRVEENGVDSGHGDRPVERGPRGRGRGYGGRGRGRGAGRFSAQGMGTFNPADYTEPSTNDGFGVKSEVWETGQNDGDDGAWRNSIEEWTAEDWNEDLSETKVFTASSVPTENHIAAGQSIDLVALLQKPQTGGTETETVGFESSQQNFGQALVFTNSQHSTQITPAASSSSAVNNYTPQSLSSVLGSGFGELGTSKLTNSSGSQILEQLKSPGLGQFTSQNPQQSSVNVTTSWDIKPSVPQSSVLSQFDFKSQPEPSPVLSQLAQRQQQHQIQPVPVPPPGLESFSPQVKLRETSPVDSSTSVGKMLQHPSLSLDSQATSAQQTHQQKHIKPQKRRIPPTSKIPSSAVEMPGSADVTGLNVQFGALEFGSEPSLPEFGSNTGPDNSSQTPNTLYSKTISDSLNTSLPISSTVQDTSYTASVITTSSHNSSSQSASPVTISSSSSSYDQTSVHSRIGYQSSMSAAEVVPVTNGHNGMRTQVSLNTTPSVPSVKSENSQSLTSVGSLSSPPSTTSALLPPPVSQHTSAVSLSSLPQAADLSSSSLSQLNSTLSGHQNNLPAASVLSSTVPHTHTSVESTVTLQPSTTYSTAPTSATSTTSSVVSMASSMNTTNSLGLSVPSVSVPTAATSNRTAQLVSSGKAPPNLPQGVPPLLHNQYIVGPGGLLPAYPVSPAAVPWSLDKRAMQWQMSEEMRGLCMQSAPVQIYGYDDLQMLQSRLPMDYYGITFPAPATLTGRDGGLASNPYSGDVAKFGRGDSASPAPATTLAQPQQNQTQTHHTAQQPFLNPTLPPGYSYTGLPYYAGVPGVPSAFQYGPTMFVPPASAKQHGVNLNAASTPFQQAGGYGQHSYSAVSFPVGYDDLTQGTTAADYSKGGYSTSAQAQSKAAGSGPGKGVSVSSSSTGVPDISGSVYNKTQTFDKQGFHAATPPPFSLPSALGSTGPLNPGAAAGYAPAPFLHILPAHQQPHSQLLHHHLQQDGQGGSGQRSQATSMQQKTQATKTAYTSSPYWTN
ncbi:ubiquitin-associated protein 2 isoform X3 [Hyperolius riggenbachi]|uniref:ubiquitin-associated protein 2 isoform X3 n=1 Tax=Hyperolius riggenbachi TaxID=752182 RepID=UPI0035A3CC80